jgi:glutamine amidotransferase
MILIPGYGFGNSGSIINMINRLGSEAMICNDPSELKKAKKIILPGVGSFDNGISNLHAHNWSNVLNEMVMKKNIPILGICLGMQLMCISSEEGSLKGLGWIDADVKKFSFLDRGFDLKIPHMGWNNIEPKKSSKLISPSEEEERFYFVHSYHVECHDSQDVLATTNYGYDFTSAFSKNNIYGVQFHPEKSHKFGMRLINNFIKL